MCRPSRRTFSSVLIAVVIVAGTAVAAQAITGSVPLSKSVIFYYGETSGSGDSNNFDGGSIMRMCAHSEGYSSQSYIAEIRQNRTLQTDLVIRSANVQYNAYVGSNYYQSSSYSTSSSNRYHAKSGWSGVPAAPNTATGSVASFSSC